MAVQFRAALIAAVAFVLAARVVQLTIVEDTRRLLRESFAVFVLGLIGGTWWALQMVGGLQYVGGDVAGSFEVHEVH